MIWSENRSLWNRRRQKPDRREKHKGCQSLPAGHCSGFDAPGPATLSELGTAKGPKPDGRAHCPMQPSGCGEFTLYWCFLTGDKPREIG